MDPIARQRLAEGRFGLSNLVFVMGKNQVSAATMDVERLSKILRAHRRALDVPAGSPRPPGTIPRRFARFAGFPQRKIKWRPLPLIDLDAGARFQLIDVLARQLPVPGKAVNRIENVAIDLVSQSLFFKPFYKRDDLGNMKGRSRFFGRTK